MQLAHPDGFRAAGRPLAGSRMRLNLKSGSVFVLTPVRCECRVQVQIRPGNVILGQSGAMGPFVEIACSRGSSYEKSKKHGLEPWPCKPETPKP